MELNEVIKAKFTDMVRVYQYSAGGNTYVQIEESDGKQIFAVLTPKQVKKLRKALKKAVSA